MPKKTLRKRHLIYLFTFIPGLVCLIWQILSAWYFHPVVNVLLVIVLVLILYRALHFALYLPASLKRYGALELIDGPKLNETIESDYNINFYKILDQNRTCPMPALLDVVSDLTKSRNDEIKILINPDVMDRYPNLLAHLCTRRLLQARHGYLAWNLFYLVFPVLLVLNLLVMFASTNLFQQISLTAHLYKVFLPLILLALFVVLTVSWNSLILANEKRLDRLMLSYYSADEIKKAIYLEAYLEGKEDSEKEEKIHSNDIKERIALLDAFEQETKNSHKGQ